MVLSVIWINSTEIKGGKLMGFFPKKGKLNTVKIIITIWNPKEIARLLCTNYLSLYGSDIKATFVKPEPDNMPMISSTLP